MPGFLSEYDDTTTLTFGKDGQWWVKVRKFIERRGFKRAQAALLSPVMAIRGKGDQETKGKVDSAAYQDELVFAAVLDWNLTDRDGNVLPLAPDDAKRASIDLLPEEVFEAIVTVVEKATPSTPKEEDEAAEADFQAPVEGSALAGVGAAD